MTFYAFDCNLDPMTLVLKFTLDIAKTYVFTKNEVPSFNSSNVMA